MISLLLPEMIDSYQFSPYHQQLKREQDYRRYRQQQEEEKKRALQQYLYNLNEMNNFDPYYGSFARRRPVHKRNHNWEAQEELKKCKAAKKIQHAFRDYNKKKPSLVQLKKVENDLESLLATRDSIILNFKNLKKEDVIDSNKKKIKFNSKTSPFLSFEDSLFKLVMSLDEINSFNSPFIKLTRKDLINKINANLNIVDKIKNDILQEEENKVDSDIELESTVGSLISNEDNTSTTNPSDCSASEMDLAESWDMMETDCNEKTENSAENISIVNEKSSNNAVQDQEMSTICCDEDFNDNFVPKLIDNNVVLDLNSFRKIPIL
ncbi:hypothetical protein HK099_001714 [Clydaea vesicula]|uniref:BAG domain-containing protein n=1 Tax=Clydaea vesicula TaxID=447962 RepID=A0AAD5XZL3_9FUNG|nr:hypothetical protein HK099_001714 [Clydaea vesicula]